MKWIQPELQALQNGHGMRDGRMDGQSETNIPPNDFVVRGGYNDDWIELHTYASPSFNMLI